MASGYAGRIVGTYSSGLIALDGMGRPLHLTSDNGVVGPFTLQLEVSARSFEDSIGRQPTASTITNDGARLRVGRWTVNATYAAPWSSQIDWAIFRGRPEVWLSNLHHLKDPPPPPPASAWEVRMEGRLHYRVEEFCEALKEFDVERIAHATLGMVGLGPGLTPAGDDYLSGVLLALCTAPASLRDSITPAILSGVRGRTSQISWATLQAASLGEAAEPWHRLVAALVDVDSDEVVRAASAVRRIGHSTGFWSLRGFLDTLGAVNATEGTAASPPPPQRGVESVGSA